MSDSADPAPADGDPLLAVRDLSVSFGDVDVLEGVSLSVERGEFVGLVGPNGAGKTTLLNAVNGVLAPDSGAVSVAGDTLEDLSSRATSRRVATVPQDTTVAFEFDVEAVVEMGRTPYHGRLATDEGAREAVDRALERTDTADMRDRSVGSLSGGERQRVVLARALAQETPVLLLDEPTASLDVNHQVRTLELVRDLVGSEGKAALAAIHDLDLAARFCDRIAVLADGSVLASGPPASVLTRETVRAAFDAEAAITPDPVTGTPSVTALASAADDAGDPPADLRVHVVGTGGRAARAMTRLDRAGFDVTAGVLPETDVAAPVAASLAVETVTTPPLGTVAGAAEADARALAEAADVTVAAGAVPPALDPVVRASGALVVLADGPEQGDRGTDRAGPLAGGETVRDPDELVAAVERATRARPQNVVSAAVTAANAGASDD